MKTELSAAEWRLMKLLWEKSPLTIAQMTELVKSETGWTKYTVISLLSRMENKGAVRHEEGRSKLFYPVLDKSEAEQTETRRFLDRVFNGSAGLLVNSMVDANTLSDADIEELTAILKRAKEERK